MTLNYTLPQLLKALLDQGASDLHLAVDSPPRLRIDGKMFELQLPPLQAADAKQLCYSVLTEEQKREFEQNFEIDLAFSVKNLARFRANIFLEKGHLAGAFRLIPFKIHTLRELSMSPMVETLCNLPRGLVLITGATGSGKSTTLAAMLNHINETRQDHIITLEDPVEFLHPHKASIVHQREVGSDTVSFARALKSALRQDPDVVMVGELRDVETISMALTTAETGHLVLATLHTNSAISTLTRVIDVFPAHQQAQIRAQMSFNLMGVLSQMLIPAINGGRISAMEILIPNQAIRALIREDKMAQIYSAMQTGQEHTGMQTMNQALALLVERRFITREAAIAKSGDADELESLLDKRSSRKGPNSSTGRRGA